MLTTTQNARLRRLVTRLVRAEVDLSWAGSYDPRERHIYEESQKKARKAYRDFLAEITEDAPAVCKGPTE